MKSTEVDESLSTTSTDVLFQRIPTNFKIKSTGWETYIKLRTYVSNSTILSVIASTFCFCYLFNECCSCMIQEFAHVVKLFIQTHHCGAMYKHSMINFSVYALIKIFLVSSNLKLSDNVCFFQKCFNFVLYSFSMVPHVKILSRFSTRLMR